MGNFGDWLKWVGGILLFLIALGFLIPYIRGSFRAKIKYRIMDVPDTDQPHFFLALTGLATCLPTQARPTGFYVEADEIYAARREVIQSAQQTIHFETFYMTPGKRADDFAVLLMERARAGVKVLMSVDFHGASSMPKKYWKLLHSAGVEVGFFQRFSWAAPLDYNARTHRKLLLIDGKVALIGGAGVSDEWDGKGDTGGTAPWRDFEVRYEGPMVGVLEGVFMENWASVNGTLTLSPEVFRTDLGEGCTAFVTTGSFSPENSSLRILFHTSILAAKKRLWISSPYFVPDRNTREALLLAKKNHVDVRILTMGFRNDKPFVYYTARELYGDLLQAGVEIYEYQPNMMHAKVLLVDDQWISHGSTNVDQRSFFQNDEMNVSISDATLAQKVEGFLLDSFDNSILVTLSRWQQRALWDKVRGKFGLLFRELF